MAASMHSHGGMAAFSAATPLLQHTAAVPLNMRDASNDCFSTCSFAQTTGCIAIGGGPATSEAMSEEANVTVVRSCGKCPFGNCSKAGDMLGKGYNDFGAVARRKVWNHVRYSPQHEYVSHEPKAEADDMVSTLLDADPGAWLVEDEQQWTETEYQQWLDNKAQATEEAGAIPEPKGRPRPSGGGGGGRSSKSPAPKVRASSSRSDEAGEGLSAKLEEQIRRQTQNMLHFTRASSSCIQALTVAGSMARDAARTFDEQRVQLQRGVEEMIDAFGIEPPAKRKKSRNEIRDVEAIDLVRHVQRDRTSDRDRDRTRSRDR
jgi:hypothetical protein